MGCKRLDVKRYTHKWDVKQKINGVPPVSQITRFCNQQTSPWNFESVAAILRHPIKRPMVTWGQVLTSLILERLEVEKFSEAEIIIILETIADEVDSSPLPFLLCLCFHLVGRWSPVFQLTHLPWHTGTGVRSAKSKKLMSFVAKLTRKADPTFPQSQKCCNLSFFFLH